MRRFLPYFLSLTLCLPVLAQAEVPLLFSDVSSGLFRFQIKLAEQGNPEAQYKVGEMYELGKGVTKNLETAQVWYEKSAQKNHKKAKYKLMFLKIQANGLDAASKAELGVLRQEAAAGKADAQYFLGKMYATGVGVPKSLNNAITWLNKAAFNGIPEAEHEAIAAEEELVRSKDRENKKKAEALEARKKQQEEEKLKAQLKKEQEKKALAAKRRADQKAQARRQQQSQQSQADRVRADNERKARAQAEQAKLKAEQARKNELAAAKKAEKTQARSASESDPESFESDPCKGKKARFLSTCR